MEQITSETPEPVSVKPDENGGTGTEKANVESPSPSPPVEDYFAWLQALGAFCLNLNTWGLMNAFGAFQTFYELDLLSAKSPSDISWIGSTQAFLMFILSAFVGPVVDAGFLRSLLILGSLLAILGMFMTSLCSQYWQVFLAQALTMGLGFGCLYVPAPAVVSQYFHRNTALAMGVSSAGSAIGGVIYPIIFARLQPRIGFGWATRVIGFIVLATSLFPVCLMKSKSPPTRQYNLLDRTTFTDAPYLLFNLGLIFGFMGFYIIFYYIELYARQETSISPVLATYLLVIINASSLLGRVVIPFYADRIGSINVQTLVALVGAVLTFSLLAIENAPGLVVYSVIYGICAGAFMGLPAAGVVSLSADRSKIGARLGMTLAVVGCGVLGSNPIAGAIVNGRGGWTGLITWCGALLTASFISMTASRVCKIGPGFKKVI
ncbi:monocarboxylate permease-like protein [Aspergillus steynii IBT 23096]|uniref:Monocarboxylate permease-like protein n=1 Tax=Aspergillus steynii IBT 23096 TaxID=1392250 RepID=A0A2I2GFB2_9EURO|nr:monocarboxylate permease-like protein [Aspergillus steynii IBT 23096]PLB51570.1 monocarboxylate permease-like protein [Aspergillus steynii IBT 23096]